MIPFRDVKLRYAADQDGDITDVNDLDPRQKRPGVRFTCPGTGVRVLPSFNDSAEPYFYHAPLPGESLRFELRPYLRNAARLLLLQSLKYMISEEDQIILAIPKGQRVRMVDYLGRSTRPVHEDHQIRLLDGSPRVSFMPAVDGVTYDVGLERDGGNLYFRIAAEERLGRDSILGGPALVEIDISAEGDIERMSYAIMSGFLGVRQTSLVTWNMPSPPERVERMPLPKVDTLRLDVCDLLADRIGKGGFTVPVRTSAGELRRVDITASMEMVSAMSHKTRGVYVVYAGKSHLAIVPSFSEAETAELRERLGSGPATLVVSFPPKVEDAIVELAEVIRAGGFTTQKIWGNAAAHAAHRALVKDMCRTHAEEIMAELDARRRSGAPFEIALPGGLRRVSAVPGEEGERDLRLDALSGVTRIEMRPAEEGAGMAQILLKNDDTLLFHLTLSASFDPVTPALDAPGLILSYRYGGDTGAHKVLMPPLGRSGLYRVTPHRLKPRTLSGLSAALFQANRTAGVRVLTATGAEAGMIPPASPHRKLRDAPGEDFEAGGWRLVLRTATETAAPDALPCAVVTWDGVSLPRRILEDLASGSIREGEGVELRDVPVTPDAKTQHPRPPGRPRRFTVSQSKSGVISVSRDGKVFGRWVGEVDMPGHMSDLEVTDTVVRGRSVQIADPLSCLVCKHHAFGTERAGRPIHCGARNQSFRQNEAKDCPKFQRFLRDEDLQSRRVAEAEKREAGDLSKRMAYYRIDGV